MPAILSCGGGGGGGGFNGTPAELVPNLRPEKAQDLAIVQTDTSGTGTIQRVLRLSSQVSNYGEGPMELFGNIQGAQIGDIVPGFQIIHWNNGNTTSIPAGDFHFHLEHAHWHWKNLVKMTLAQAVNTTDPYDASNTVVATTNKVSFCLIDSIRLPSMPGQPSTSHYRFCNQNTQGISVGWSDIYGSQLFGQWIVIEGVPDGIYWVILETDPENLLRETDETDNRSAVKVQITGDTVTVLP